MTRIDTDNWITEPFILCPKCRHEWQKSDAWELTESSEIECPECATALVCVFVRQPARVWQWGPR